MRFLIREVPRESEPKPEKMIELWLEPTDSGHGVCLRARVAGAGRNYAWALLDISPEGLRRRHSVDPILGLAVDAAGRVALKP